MIQTGRIQIGNHSGFLQLKPKDMKRQAREFEGQIHIAHIAYLHKKKERF